MRTLSESAFAIWIHGEAQPIAGSGVQKITHAGSWSFFAWPSNNAEDEERDGVMQSLLRVDFVSTCVNCVRVCL